METKQKKPRTGPSQEPKTRGKDTQSQPERRKPSAAAAAPEKRKAPPAAKKRSGSLLKVPFLSTKPAAAPKKAAAPKNADPARKTSAHRSAAAAEETARKQPKAQPQAPRNPAVPPQPKAAASQSKPASPQSRPASAQKKPEQKDHARRSVQKEAPSYTHGLPDSVSTKKRAYGNSKPKKKTARDMITDAVKRSGERKAERIKKRQAQMEKGSKSKQRQQMNTPAVIYTQPQAFNRNRFIMQMITVVAVVVALVMGLSVFFKVEHVTVSGAEVYSAWAVRDASGIVEGDNLLTFSHARAGAKIKATLPYVRTVRFGIKLPDTVNIIIEEEDVVYAIKTHDGTWWLMTSAGRMVEQANSSKAANYTQILGVTIEEPVANEMAVATESVIVQETNEAGETVPVPVSVTGAQRLNAALQIVRALEDNDIVGEAASVDVSSLEYIVLMYGTRFQVNLGDSTNLAYKVNCMNDVILQMQDYQTGVLDISFTIWPNQVGYTPFS